MYNHYSSTDANLVMIILVTNRMRIKLGPSYVRIMINSSKNVTTPSSLMANKINMIKATL